MKKIIFAKAAAAITTIAMAIQTVPAFAINGGVGGTERTAAPAGAVEISPPANIFKMADGVGAYNEYILLDYNKNDSESTFLVMNRKSVGMSTWGGSNQKFDPTVDNSLAKKLNRKDENGKLQPEFTIANPQMINYIDQNHTWPVEAGNIAAYNVTCGITLLSYSEWERYADKIGYTRADVGTSWFLRTPIERNAIYAACVDNSLADGVIGEASMGASRGVRPVYWLSAEAFSNVRIDIENIGSNVIAALRDVYYQDQLSNIYESATLNSWHIPERDAYTFGEYKLVEPGRVIFDISKNYEAELDADSIIYAVYDSDNVLKDIKITTDTDELNNIKNGGVGVYTIEQNDIPSLEANDTLKIFFWNLHSMKPGIKAKSAECADSAFEETFLLKDYMGLYDFPEELVTYSVEFNGLVPEDELKLTVDGVETEYQLSCAEKNDLGYLESADVSFRTDLNKGESKDIVLSYNPSENYSAKAAIKETNKIKFITNEADNTAIIDTGTQSVKVPYGIIEGDMYFSKAYAPILQAGRDAEHLIGSGSMVWLGANGGAYPGKLDSYTHEPLCKKVEAGWAEQGELFGCYRIKYDIQRNSDYSGTYTVDININYGEEYITVDEYVEGNLGNDNNNHGLAFKFSLDDIDPTYRLGMSNGGYGVDSLSAGFYAKEYAGDQNLMPGRINCKVGQDVYGTYSWCFWNPDKENAVVFSPTQTKNWEYARGYDGWSWDYWREELNFFNVENGGDTEKFMRVSIYTPERHWAMSIIPAEDVVINSLIDGRTYEPQFDENGNFTGEDSEGSAYGTNAATRWGAGPEVRLWQKLTDLSLDFYKDIKFDFEEHLDHRFDLPNYSVGELDIDEFKAYDKFETHFVEIMDRYWNYEGELGGVFGSNKAGQAVAYAYNRENWSEEDRIQVRSWFIWFITALKEGENPMAARYTPLLGGQPNFMAPWILDYYAMAALFPEHPDAKSWKETGDYIWEKFIDLYVRKANITNNTAAGRFMENPICYNFASLEHLWRADYSLDEYNKWLAENGREDEITRKTIWEDEDALNWAEWLLNILIPNVTFVDDGVRIPPTEGAHANINLFNENADYYECLRFLGLRLQEADSARAKRIGSNIIWSITGGEQGTQPVLESTLYTDYGPVLHYGEAGSENEAYLHLTQVDGRNYRWGTKLDYTNGSLFYSAGGKSWSINDNESNGDAPNVNAITNFTTEYGNDRRGIYNGPSNGVLFNFDWAQQYYATANVSSNMNGRGVMMIRDDYIAVLDDVKDKSDNTGRFTWVNETNRGFTIDYFENADFTGQTKTTYGYRSNGDGRFPLRYNIIEPGTETDNDFMVDSRIENYNSFSVRFTAKYKPSASSITLTQILGTKDVGKLTFNGEVVLNGGNGTSCTIDGLVPGQAYDLAYEYAHNPNNEPDGGTIQLDVDGIDGNNLYNELGLPNITPALDTEGLVGDQLHIVSPATKQVTVESQEEWGAEINNNGKTEYVLYSSVTSGVKNVNKSDMTFNGNWGYARENELALFNGTEISFGGFGLACNGGDFGASAEISGNQIKGRFAGKSGGTITITPGAEISGTPSVTVDGQSVEATVTDNTVSFPVTITQGAGIKDYTITF